MDSQSPPTRKRRLLGMNAMWVVVGSLGIVAGLTSFAAELKKNKVKDLTVDGNLCFLPKSPAFELGITASVCLLCAHFIGHAAIGITYFSRDNKAQLVDKTKAIAIALSVLSWGCLAMAILLLGVGSSMNQEQPYGQGWLEGECYLVKSGVYSAASLLAIITVTCTVFVYLAITKRFEMLLEVRPETKQHSKGVEANC